MCEIWKDIEGYEGLYQISNKGRVKSFVLEKKLLKPKLVANGYYQVDLTKPGTKKKQILVHRLVAKAFLENKDNLPCVNHKDENKTNNNVENLEWCTYKYNSNYGNRNKTIANKLSKKVLCVETGIVYKSIMEAQRITGIDNSMIVAVCKGRRKTTNSLHWKYV